MLQGCDVLLIRRARDPWKDCWDIPGGFVEPDEHPSSAAERELFEETGLRGHASDLLGMWLDRYGAPDPDGMRIATLNIAYLVTLLSDEQDAVADDETLETVWFPLNELPQNLAFADHAWEVLREAARRS